MTDDFQTDNPELETLFERYRAAPDSYVFAPLADACRKAGMVEAAIEICEKGVSAHPDYPSGFVIRGKCYMDIGNHDQAEASFEKVLELDPNNLVALRYTGVILAERGEGAAARSRFTRILALDPADKEIRELLLAAESAPAPSRPDHDDGPVAPDVGPPTVSPPESRPRVDAVDDDEELDDEFNPDEISLGDDEPTPDALATLTLADIYASQGHTARAVRIYREILDKEPGNPIARKRLADLGEDVPPSRSESPPASRSSTPPRETSDGAPLSTFARMVEDDDGVSGIVERPSHDERPPHDETAERTEPSERTERTETSERSERSEPAAQPGPRDADRNVDQFRRWIRNLTR